VPTVSAVPSNPEVLSTPPTPAPARSASSSSSSSINQTPAQVRSTPTTPFAGSTINVFSNMSSSAPPSPLSSASTESRSSDSGYEQIGDSPPVPGTRSFLSATPSTSRDQFVPNNSQPDTNSTPGNANSTYTRNVPRDHTVEEITEDSLFPETDTTTEQLASKSIANLIKEDASKAAFLSELWKAPTDSIDVKIINKKPKVAYYPEQILGVGGFGTVYGGYLEIPSRKVAVKVTRRNDMEQKKCKELEIHRSISHRNIVKYLFAAFEPDVCYLVMELATMTLEEWVRKYAENCHHELRVQFCKDAATGLRKLHKLGIVHRDIKPNNVLLFFTDTDPVAKLTDFGISRVLDRRVDGVTTDRGNRGTITYMPPEAQAANGKFNLPLTFDIFSLGLVLAFTMTGGTHIFSNKPHEPPIITACNIAVYGPESPNWNYISSIEHTALRNLLEVMIAKDTSQRSSMSRIVEHPFFWGTQRQFDFILAVSNDLTNAKNPAAADHCRKSITEAYKRFCHDEYGFLADWKERLAPEIREWMAQKDLTLRATKKNGIGWREYQADSLLHLIKFIRDQDQHNGNWNLHPQLTTPHIFGTDGTRYSAYFIRTFPEISTVLFSLFHCPSFKDIQLKTKDFVSSEEGVVFKHWMP
jgi:serine/threonine protein kinase